MRPRLISYLAVSMLAMIGQPARLSAGIFVDDGTLGVGCSNPFGFTFQFINQLQNPMMETRSVPLHNSLATAAYNFNWNLATGHFRIDGNLASEGGDGLPFCGTDNRIDFHITQVTLLSIDSEWTYQFNGGIRTSTIRFWVVDRTTNITVFTRGDVGDTVAGDPWTDTFHVNGSIMLTPGSYFVRSLMDLRAVGGSANSVSTAHGIADITLTTVPEPASLGALAIAAVMLLRRTRGLRPS